MKTKDTARLLKMYNPFDMTITRAGGIYIYSDDGLRYIDTFSGIGVSAFGHSYKPLIDRLTAKMNLYMHVSNFFVDDDAVFTADRLVGHTSCDGRVFFTNSGTEATEAVLKAVKKASIKNKRKIIFFKDGFHGRTLGALSLNGFKKMREPFEPLLMDTYELEYNNIMEFEYFMKHNGPETVAVFVEPVQGSGGVVPMLRDFADCITQYRQKHGFFLVSDETQAGLGRTGEIYSYQNYNLHPDMITCAKALGGGLPLGAAIFLGDTADILKTGDHGSTFAPNPVALAGARFILEALPDMLSEIKEKGRYFIEKIKSIGSSKIVSVRGSGLMIGVALDREYHNIRDAAFKNERLLLNVLSNKTIRLLPPLNIEYSQIDEIVEKLKCVIAVI